MITVNLLPYDLRPIKRTPVPYIASGAVLVLAILTMGIMFVSDLASITLAERQLDQHKQELAALEPVVQEYNALTDKKRQLHEQVVTINDISRDRIIWSRQLQNLNRLALDNMWYDTIAVQHKPFTESKNVYNPKTKQMETQTVRIERQVLTVSGYVVAGPDGQSSISPFTLATENDQEFSGLFQLDQSTFRDTSFEDVGVREFSLEYIVARGGKEND
jgi:Tfp pilus assembly protein PilN